jgi:hypothetical protein
VEIQKADSHISTTHYDLELAIDSRFIEDTECTKCLYSRSGWQEWRLPAA